MCHHTSYNDSTASLITKKRVDVTTRVRLKHIKHFHAKTALGYISVLS